MKRLASVYAIALALAACAPKAPPTVSPQERAAQQVGGADALVRAGCDDCLVEALGRYDEARTVPATADIATAGAVRAAMLLAMRERELGFIDSGYMARAHELAGTNPGVQTASAFFLNVAATMPMQGGRERVSSDAELSVMSAAYRNRVDWTGMLLARVNEDVFSTIFYSGVVRGELRQWLGVTSTLAKRRPVRRPPTGSWLPRLPPPARLRIRGKRRRDPVRDGSAVRVDAARRGLRALHAAEPVSAVFIRRL